MFWLVRKRFQKTRVVLLAIEPHNKRFQRQRSHSTDKAQDSRVAEYYLLTSRHEVSTNQSRVPLGGPTAAYPRLKSEK